MHLLKKIFFLLSGICNSAYKFVAILLLFLPQSVKSQLAVNNSAPYNDPSYLVQNILLNPGVTISNVTFNGQTGIPTGASAQMIGFFDGTSSNIGIMNGVVLVTGPITGAVGPNNSPSFGTDNGTPGDADLDSWSGRTTFNAAVLEFDFTSASDKVSLRYVFASEEYDEWVCTQYNDIFAFFVSGPGIAGKKNIALIPSTNTAVAINSVNNGTVGSNGSAADCISLSYSQYFVDNGDGYTPGANPTVQFDGFTTPLIAMSPTLIPCETYHMKIAVADASDGIYDSGVFLESASFGAAGLQVHIGDVLTSSNTIQEGCGPIDLIFTRSGSTSMPYTLHFVITGSATNGSDYTQIADSIVIPAGSSTATYSLDIFVDGIFENNETVVITIPANTSNNTCLDDYPSEAQLLIVNTQPLALSTSNDTLICPGDVVPLVAGVSNGVPPYTYTWSTGSTASSISVSPSMSTTYFVTVTDQCKTDTIIKPILVIAAGLLVSYTQQTPSIEGCNDATVTFMRAGPNSSPYTVYFIISGTATNGTDYAFITDSIVIPAGQSTVDMTITPYADLSNEGPETIIITTLPDPGNFCLSNDSSKATITIFNVDTIALQVSSDTSICAGNAVTLIANASGGFGPLQYVWSNGGGMDDTANVVPLDTTTYNVVVVDTCGNANTRGVTVNVIPPASQLSVTTDVMIEGCKGADIELQRNDDTTNAINLYFTISGSADNGTDYNFISDSIFVAAGQGSATINLFPFFDGATETVEDIIISLVVDTNCVTYLTKDTIRIINVDPLTVSTSNDTILCTRTNTILSSQVSGGYGALTYMWQDSITQQYVSFGATATVNPFTTDNYFVYVTDSCGNTASDAARVWLTGVSISGDTVAVEGCGDIKIKFTRADSIGDLTVQYRISGTAENGLDYNLLSGSLVIPNGSFYGNISLTPPYDALSEGNETIALAVSDGTGYDVCPDSVLNIRIQNVEPITVSATGDMTICNEFVPVQATASGGWGNLAYLWSSGQTDSAISVNPAQTILYVIYVSDICTTPRVTDSVTITVDCEYRFFIPNAFTPNGDGFNEYFTGTGKGIKKYEMFIIDRWGDVVYYTDQIPPAGGWDGHVNNGRNHAQQDIYVYKVITTDLLDNDRTYLGRVALIR